LRGIEDLDRADEQEAVEHTSRRVVRDARRRDRVAAVVALITALGELQARREAAATAVTHVADRRILDRREDAEAGARHTISDGAVRPGAHLPRTAGLERAAVTAEVAPRRDRNVADVAVEIRIVPERSDRSSQAEVLESVGSDALGLAGRSRVVVRRVPAAVRDRTVDLAPSVAQRSACSGT